MVYSAHTVQVVRLGLTLGLVLVLLQDLSFYPVTSTSVVPTIFLLFSPYLLIGRSVFVAVQGSCTYAGTKLCLNDHYLCETFSLGWTIHHCNATPMWGLISLLVSHIEDLSQLAWMPTYGTAIRDFRHQTAVYLELQLGLQ